jgi:hypothetical protein
MPEVEDSAGWAVVGRVGGVQDREDPVDENRGADGGRGDDRQQAAALAQLQDLGAYEPRTGQGERVREGCHAASSSRDVISRNRRSSETCSGSRR